MRQKSSFNNKVLFVDDDKNLLAAIERKLHRMFFVRTAEGGKEGLKVLEKEGPFAVVISDMDMPEMGGLHFLLLVKDRFPETVRVILSGKADVNIALNAVNIGNVFRYILKPCSTPKMLKLLEEAFDYYYYATQIKVILEKTLKGSVDVLLEVLSLVNPIAFSQTTRTQNIVKQMASIFKMKEILNLDLAAMLLQIGCVTVPPIILERGYRNEKLSEEELKILENYPEVSYKLVSSIPGLEEVSDIILGLKQPYQEKNMESIKDQEEKNIIWFSEILKAVVDFDILLCRGMSKQHAIKIMEDKKGYYSSLILSALNSVKLEDPSGKKEKLRVNISDIQKGMFLEEDIKTLDGGIKLISKGQPLNYVTRALLENYLKQKKIADTVLVCMPVYNT